MLAAAGRIAGVIRAHIAVVAVERRAGHAASAGARIIRRARAAIGAGVGIVCEHANAALAGIRGAHVAVIALCIRSATDAAVRRPVTASAGAHVVARARLAIITGVRIIRMRAACDRVAAIGRADVSVVTIRRRTRNAGST